MPAPKFFKDQMPFLQPNQQRQNTEANIYTISKKSSILHMPKIIKIGQLMTELLKQVKRRFF